MVDAEDAFPQDASETTDTDGDGVGDTADTDVDGDGVADSDGSASQAEGGSSGGGCSLVTFSNNSGHRSYVAMFMLLSLFSLIRLLAQRKGAS